MTTQTRRVYVPITSLRPECCFEVSRTDHPNGDEYTTELISGDVDCADLEDAEDAAIEQAKALWETERDGGAEARRFEASRAAMVRGINEAEGRLR